MAKMLTGKENKAKCAEEKSRCDFCTQRSLCLLNWNFRFGYNSAYLNESISRE